MNQLELQNGAPTRPALASQDTPILKDGQRTPLLTDLTGNTRVVLPSGPLDVGAKVANPDERALLEAELLNTQALQMNALDPNWGFEVR